MADGGLLVLLDARSHAVYWREEVGALRLMIDNKTCLIEQENDPTQLRSPSPGKLVRFLVESGEHVKAGEAFAEIEVMKMYMPLIAAEDGCPQFIKQPGGTLEAGDIVGILTLDDPSRVHHAKPFEGQLPQMGLPSIVGNKPAQRFAALLDTLQNILLGFDNQSVLHSSVKELISVLRNPELPYSEASSILSTLSGRMSPHLETGIRSTIETAAAKGLEFPAARILRLIEQFMAENIRPQDRLTFLASLAGFDVMVQRYSKGLAAHEWHTIGLLFQAYIDTEKVFSGRTDDAVLALRDAHRDSLDVVAGLVLSHNRAASKNNLILVLLDHIKREGSQVALDPSFSGYLRDIANLDSKATAVVALKAREVIVSVQVPSLGERRSQMEQILRSSVSSTRYGERRVNGNEPDTEMLHELIDSRYTTYDVLPSFFLHQDQWLALAALEAYVRRAYRAYNIESFDYQTGDSIDEEPLSVAWKFRLSPREAPSSPSRATFGESSRVASFSDLTYMVNRGQDEPLRHGIMYSASTLETLEKGLLGAVRNLPEERKSLSADTQNKPNNVVNAVLLMSEGAPEKTQDTWLRHFTEIAERCGKELSSHGVGRVSFVLFHLGQYPAYFTLRYQEGTWKELEAIRDIEPALAYQLELDRLVNFNLQPCGVENRQIHVFYATAKENSADARFFVRALVRPGRLRSGASMPEYLESETECVFSQPKLLAVFAISDYLCSLQPSRQ